MGISRDITHQKQAEEALREAHEELERRVEKRTLELSNANALLRREINEWKRAESALQYRIELETIITTVSTHFINLAPDQIDMGINISLQTIGEFAGVDRSYIFLFRDTGTKVDNTHEWCREGIEPQIHRLQGVSVDALPWFVEKIKRLEIIHIPRVADLPPGASPEKDKWRSQGVQSVISVPMVYGGRLLGLLGFDSVRVEKKWPEDIIALLKIVGEMFVNALERKWADGQLKASLKEKELLLKEVHHRVKNNLQIMSSLLNLQSGYINDKQTLEMFKESQNRVKSMALIHEKLYESEGLTGIDFAEYIRNLTAYLFRLYEVNAKAISLKIDAEKVFLDVSTAISCGLILTELLSNALKYAFPAGREGEIFIDLRSHSNERIKLSVSDNGIGLPKDLDFRNTDSLGLQLVCALTDQLRGTIELERSAGTAFVITFGGLNPRQRD